MKLQHVLMALGLALGVGLVFFGEKNVNDDVVTAVVRPKQAGTTVIAETDSGKTVAASAAKPSYAKSERVVPILALTDRKKLISVGHVGLDGKNIASSAQIFGTQSWVPPPPVELKPKNPPPPPPPTAPPLNFKFIGKKLEDGIWEVYLSRGDTSFIARPLEVIDGNYRVDSITQNALVLTYLPLNQVQRMNIKG
jgi:hypothetical protein